MDGEKCEDVVTCFSPTIKVFVLQLKSYCTITLFIIRSDWSSSACKSSCLYSPQGSLASGSSGLVQTKRFQSTIDTLMKITKRQASYLPILLAFAIQEMQGVER